MGQEDNYGRVRRASEFTVGRAGVISYDGRGGSEHPLELTAIFENRELHNVDNQRGEPLGPGNWDLLERRCTIKPPVPDRLKNHIVDSAYK